MAGIVERAQAVLDNVAAWTVTHPGVDPSEYYLQTLSAIEDPQLKNCVVALQRQRRSSAQIFATEEQRKKREAKMALAIAVASDITNLSESNSLPVEFPEVLLATEENPSLTLRRLRYAIENGGVQKGQILQGFLSYGSHGSETSYSMQIIRSHAGNDAMIRLFALNQDSDMPTSVLELGNGVWYRPIGSNTIGFVGIGSRLSSDANVNDLARIVHQANLLVRQNANTSK